TLFRPPGRKAVVDAGPPHSALPDGNRGARVCAGGGGERVAVVLSVLPGDGGAVPRRLALARGGAGDLPGAARFFRGRTGRFSGAQPAQLLVPAVGQSGCH